MGNIFLPPAPLPKIGTLHAGTSITHALHPGQSLLITAPAEGSGYVEAIEDNPGEVASGERIPVPADASTRVGPFDSRKAFRVHCHAGGRDIVANIVGRRA